MLVLQRIREFLALLLIGLLPFHALLVTVLTKVIAGPDHAPLTTLALWKEGALAIILGIAIVECIANYLPPVRSGDQPGRSTINHKPDRIDLVIVALLILSFLVTFFTHHNWSLYLFGFRYDFVPLIAFLILRRVPWSAAFWRNIVRVILSTAVLVCVFALASLLLPVSAFRALGYSDLHSLYVPGGPLAPFQQIGGSALRRLQGPMSGPNQLGVWLLIPLGIVLTYVRHSTFHIQSLHKLGWLLMLFGLTLLLTFSRAAWIGLLVMLVLAVWPALRKLSTGRILGLGLVLIGAACIASFLFPSVVLRVASSEGHIRGPVEALQNMIEHPWGMGLGTAGPASNRISDACVMLEEGADTSWAVSHPDLCVFTGDTQVQPTDRACSCPFLPENWYLQIGVEMGLMGMVLYLLLIGFVVGGQWSVVSKQWSVNSEQKLTTDHWLLFSLTGVSVAALFLHAFEDAAVSYLLWVMLAALFHPSRVSLVHAQTDIQLHP